MPEPIGSSSTKRAYDDTSTSTTSSSTPSSSAPPTGVRTANCDDGAYAVCANYDGYDPADVARHMAKSDVTPTQRLDGLGWGELERRMKSLTDKLAHAGPYSGREADERALLALESEWTRRKSFATPAPAPKSPPPATPPASSGASGAIVTVGPAKVATVSGHASGGSVGVDAAAGSVGGKPSDRTAANGNALHAYADAGVTNVDGSKGVHVAVGANTADGEATYGDAKAGTVTLGLSEGAGFEWSLGIRDDGALCYRLGVGPVLVGACTGETLPAPETK